MDEPPDAASSPPKRRLTAPPGPRWIGEAILILVSVALGFGASEFGQYRQERGLARKVLQAVAEEVEQNAADLGAAAAKHREWERALRHADVSGGDKAAFQILLDSRPTEAGSIIVPLKSAAWQMMVSSGALRLIDFEVGQAISDVYSKQILLTEFHNRTVADVLWTPEAFDPAKRPLSTKLIWAVMSEVSGNEEMLVELYRKHLPLLRRAASD